MYVFLCKQLYLARLNLEEKAIFKAENETMYSTNDHLWRSKLSKNWKYPAIEEGEGSASRSKQREEQRER